MEVLVASISGGHFPYQICAEMHLSRYDYEPKLCMGGSGGIVSIYCAEAGHWNPSHINRVASSLHHRLFIEKWMGGTAESVIPDPMISYFHGSMYKTSDRSKEILKAYFQPHTITETEIWTCAVNEADNTVALFCNRSYNDGRLIIRGEYLNARNFNYEDIRYLDGNLDDITKSIVATASIPMLIDSTEIGNKRYADCGTKYGSPLTPLANEIRKISRDIGVHMVYLSGYDVQTNTISCSNIRHGCANMMERAGATGRNVSRNMVEQDRRCAISIIDDLCDRESYYSCYDIDELERVLIKRKEYKSSLVEIYPLSDEELDIFNFGCRDVREFMKNGYNKLGVRLWTTD